MIKVNKDKCTGCNICVNMCPQGFAMEGLKARVKDPDAACVQAAVEVCPTGAIELEGEQSQIKQNAARPSGGQTGSNINRPGRGMGQGRNVGRGAGQGSGGGVGPGGYCVCPSCGHKEPHQRGQPCFERKCPECGSVMTRQR